jgi:hypothetical protein
MSRVSGALCSLLSDAGGALLVVGSRYGEHLLHIERQRGGWRVDAVLEQEFSPRAQSAAQAQHQSVRLRLLRRTLRRGAPIWALLVAFALQDRLGHVLRSRAGRVDEHW